MQEGSGRRTFNPAKLREQRCRSPPPGKRGGGARGPRGQPSSRDVTGCLNRILERGAAEAAADPSADFCRQRLSICIQQPIAQACRASCSVCTPAATSNAAALPAPTSAGAAHVAADASAVAVGGGGSSGGGGGSSSGGVAVGGGKPLGLWLAYLLSYEHMGRAAIECSGSCACSGVVDAHNVLSRTSVTAVQRVVVTQLPGAAGRGCCHLTLRVLKETSSGSTKFKLLSLLLAQPQRRGGKDDWQPPGIKVVAAPTLGDLMHFRDPKEGSEY